MSKYLVFGGDDYYPRGGWLDFRGEFVTLEEATAYAEKLANRDDSTWSQVVEDGKLIFDSWGNTL